MSTDQIRPNPSSNVPDIIKHNQQQSLGGPDLWAEAVARVESKHAKPEKLTQAYLLFIENLKANTYKGIFFKQLIESIDSLVPYIMEALRARGDILPAQEVECAVVEHFMAQAIRDCKLPLNNERKFEALRYLIPDIMKLYPTTHQMNTLGDVVAGAPKGKFDGVFSSWEYKLVTRVRSAAVSMKTVDLTDINSVSQFVVEFIATFLSPNDGSLQLDQQFVDDVLDAIPVIRKKLTAQETMPNLEIEKLSILNEQLMSYARQLAVQEEGSYMTGNGDTDVDYYLFRTPLSEMVQKDFKSLPGKKPWFGKSKREEFKEMVLEKPVKPVVKDFYRWVKQSLELRKMGSELMNIAATPDQRYQGEVLIQLARVALEHAQIYSRMIEINLKFEGIDLAGFGEMLAEISLARSRLTEPGHIVKKIAGAHDIARKVEAEMAQFNLEQD